MKCNYVILIRCLFVLVLRNRNKANFIEMNEVFSCSIVCSYH